MKISSALFLFIALLAVGCSEHIVNPISKPLDTSVISPLVTGDEWIYEVTLLDSAGVQVEYLQDTVRVGLSADLQGETWYLVSHHNKNINNDPTFSFFFANRKDGYYFFDEGKQKPSLSFKYPALAGTIYNDRVDTLFGSGRNFQGSHSYTKVISSDEIITIGSSTYQCYHYQSFEYFFENGSDTVNHKPITDNYFTPGIGQIKSIMRFEESFNPKTGVTIKNGSEITTLKSYTLK